MKTINPMFLVLLLCAALTGLAIAEESKTPETISAEEMDAMMAKAREITSTGTFHEWLERFEGTWESETRVMMPGAKPDKGTSTFSWLIDGRWMQMKGSGSMMGMPSESFMLLGYDTFKMSYVLTMVSSMDNAMLRAEGDIDPKTGALILYGTLDEYLTGEHDKMVKYVWRFKGDDAMTFEVHDLPIGESNTKVVEVTFKRRPDESGGDS
jgi:hypothetical protein